MKKYSNIYSEIYYYSLLILYTLNLIRMNDSNWFLGIFLLSLPISYFVLRFVTKMFIDMIWLKNKKIISYDDFYRKTILYTIAPIIVFGSLILYMVESDKYIKLFLVSILLIAVCIYYYYLLNYYYKWSIIRKVLFCLCSLMQLIFIPILVWSIIWMLTWDGSRN
jgi:hypothetical protein